jgi:hypothetical protein
MAHRLTLQRFARFLLAWYVAFVGVGTLSPLFKPVDLMLVCSASGSSWVPPIRPTTRRRCGHRHAIAPCACRDGTARVAAGAGRPGSSPGS